VRPNAESPSYRSQGGRRGLTVHGAFADTDHQRAAVLAADPRPSRPWPNPDSDPHKVSVIPAPPQFTLMPPRGERIADELNGDAIGQIAARLIRKASAASKSS
jgi:hypothetical protein